jgi:hypothetical protein
MCLAIGALVDGPLGSTKADLTVPLDEGAIGLDELEDVSTAYRHLAGYSRELRELSEYLED